MTTEDAKSTKTYLQMVQEAIKEDNSKSGTSRQVRVGYRKAAKKSFYLVLRPLKPFAQCCQY